MAVAWPRSAGAVLKADHLSEHLARPRGCAARTSTFCFQQLYYAEGLDNTAALAAVDYEWPGFGSLRLQTPIGKVASRRSPAARLERPGNPAARRTTPLIGFRPSPAL